MAGTENHPWDEFEALKEESFLYIDQGLKLEQTAQPQRAFVMYQKGLAAMDKALDIPLELPGATSKSLGRLKATRTKMMRTRQQIVFRIRELEALRGRGLQTPTAPPERHPSNGPPSYEDASGQASAPTIQNSAPDLPSDADILFTIPGDVNVFYINSQGGVTLPYDPSSLHLYRFKEETKDASSLSPALLQVGTWVYPLVPGQSPVLKSTRGSYMFPDLDDSVAGNAIGIIFPPTISDEEVELFETLLNHFTAVKDREDLAKYDEYIQYSNQVAKHLAKGAEAFGKGMVKGSVKAGELMQISAEKIKDRVTPAAETVSVDPRLKTGLDAAQWASGKAVKVSGYLVSKAGAATVALGRFLAPHIQSGGAKALSHFVEQSEEKSRKQMAVASEITSGGVAAISTIYMALENSSKILAKNLADSTVKVVKHRYGNDVGDVTNDALTTAGNTYLAVYNASVLGPKGLAKKVAKDTGKMAVGVPEEVIRGQVDVTSDQPGPVNGDAKLKAIENGTKEEEIEKKP